MTPVRTALTSVAVLLFLACGAAHANLVVNGGFETGDFTGWAVSGAAFDCGNTIPGISSLGPHSGTYSACFGNPESMTYISQTLTTIPGQEYAFTFYYAQQPEDQTPSNQATVIWGAVALANDVQNVPVTTWQLAGGLELATGTSTTIEFGFENGPGWFALDDVDVETVAPEPQAMLLCGLGLGILGLLRRASAR
jgi:hypothetical protein